MNINMMEDSIFLFDQISFDFNNIENNSSEESPDSINNQGKTNFVNDATNNQNINTLFSHQYSQEESFDNSFGDLDSLPKLRKEDSLSVFHSNSYLIDNEGMMNKEDQNTIKDKEGNLKDINEDKVWLSLLSTKGKDDKRLPIQENHHSDKSLRESDSTNSMNLVHQENLKLLEDEDTYSKVKLGKQTPKKPSEASKINKLNGSLISKTNYFYNTTVKQGLHYLSYVYKSIKDKEKTNFTGKKKLLSF